MDVGNISDREFQIELLRSVLKLPEDLITKIVGLAYEEALEHIIEVFTVYDVKTKTFSRQTDSARIKERHYTDIDSYNINFNGYDLCQYDIYNSPEEAREIREILYKEFDAYCEIMDLILKYMDHKKKMILEELMNKFFPEEDTEENKEDK